MNPLARKSVLLLLTGLVLISGFAGFLLGHRFARRQIEVRNDPVSWNEHVSREFDRMVQPTPEQSARIQPYLDEAVKQLQQIRLETIGHSSNVIWKLIAKVETELTPEQRQNFDKMKPRPSDLTLELLQVSPANKNP